MTKEEFCYKADSEGLGYLLTDYLSKDSLNKIKDKEIKELCLQIVDPLNKLNDIVTDFLESEGEEDDT